MSIGVMGYVDKTQGAVKFFHEFSEDKITRLFEEAEVLSLHPVYASRMIEEKVAHKTVVKTVKKKHTPQVITHPTDYLPEKESPKDLEAISDKTMEHKKRLVEKLSGINMGQAQFRDYEKWVQSVFNVCFMGDLLFPEDQVQNHDGSKKFEIIFDINGKDAPWSEIKDNFATHRLLIECKNKEIPDDADFSKVDRDMGALNLNVAFIVYRADKREPKIDVLKYQRSRYQDSGKRKVIVSITDAFLLQCLKKNDEKSVRVNLNKLWRDHMERWLVV